MIAETLLTPHPEKRKSSEPQQLYDSLDVNEMRVRLNAARRSGALHQYNRERVDTANRIASRVNESLRQSRFNDDIDAVDGTERFLPRSIEQLDHRQLLGCYGYTIATSELLDDLEIEHWIAHSNGPIFHAFILIPDARISGKGDALHLIDPLFPDLSCDIGDSIAWGTVKALDGEIRVQDVSSVVIDGSDLARKHKQKFADFAGKYKWTSNVGDNEAVQSILNRVEERSKNEEELKRSKKYSELITTVFASSPGRHALDQCAKFKQATYFGRYDEAVEIADDLYGFIPYIDVRRSCIDAEECTAYLADSSETGAVDFLSRYFDSLRRHSLDPRIEIMQGDVLSRVAAEIGSAALLKEAIRSYESVSGRAPYKKPGLQKLVTGKITKRQCELAELDSV